MAYTTRIELHGATDYNTYSLLHKEMESRGFVRRIKSDAGVEYELPWAEYNYEGVSSMGEVLRLSESAVSTVGKSAAILVTASSGRMWSGLALA